MLHQGKVEKVFTICYSAKGKLAQKWAWEKGHPKVVFKEEAVLKHDTLPAVTDKDAEIPMHVPHTTFTPSTRSILVFLSLAQSPFHGQSS